MHEMAGPQKSKEDGQAKVKSSSARLVSRRVPSQKRARLATLSGKGSSKHGCGGGAPPVGRPRAPATFLVVPARAPREAAPDDEPVAAVGEHYPAPALRLRRRRHQGRGEQGT